MYFLRLPKLSLRGRRTVGCRALSSLLQISRSSRDQFEFRYVCALSLPGKKPPVPSAANTCQDKRTACYQEFITNQHRFIDYRMPTTIAIVSAISATGAAPAYTRYLAPRVLKPRRLHQSQYANPVRAIARPAITPAMLRLQAKGKYPHRMPNPIEIASGRKAIRTRKWSLGLCIFPKLAERLQ